MGYHKFHHPIRTVAVVGAGASGAPAARHLRDSALEVTVFERQSAAGGIWNWSSEISTPLSVPTPPPSHGAFIPWLPDGMVGPEQQTTVREDNDREIRNRFSPPNPVYASLSNNVPTSTMAFKDFPYPPGTPENIPHHQIAGYVRDYVKHFELDNVIEYNTRVEKAVKIPATDAAPPKWRLTLRKVESDGVAKAKESFWIQDFDALVVATGHYNAPFIPDIEGASAWAAQWPGKILHSNGYRIPQPFEGKVRLVDIVGVGTSGIDIARDLSPVAKQVYMVGKNAIRGPDGYQTMRRFQRHVVPGIGEPLPEIKRFLPPVPGAPVESGRLELTDGRIITDLSLVLFATGYQYSCPFLPQFHRDPQYGGPDAHTKSKLLVTDGGGVLNLYRDVFFVPDPTLAFLGLSVNTSAFSFFEFQSISVARVFTSAARLPDAAGRRAAYNALIAEKGEGKFSHFMGKDNERKYVRETVEWLNRDAEWSGAEKVVGHTPEWIAASDRAQGLIFGKYGLDHKAILADIKAQLEAEKVAPIERRSRNLRVPSPVLGMFLCSYSR